MIGCHIIETVSREKSMFNPKVDFAFNEAYSGDLESAVSLAAQMDGKFFTKYNSHLEIRADRSWSWTTSDDDSAVTTSQ